MAGLRVRVYTRLCDTMRHENMAYMSAHILYMYMFSLSLSLESLRNS